MKVKGTYLIFYITKLFLTYNIESVMKKLRNHFLIRGHFENPSPVRVFLVLKLKFLFFFFFSDLAALQSVTMKCSVTRFPY